VTVIEQQRSDIKPVSDLHSHMNVRPSIIFTDVDDTLTHEGRLPAETFQALYQLRESGFVVVPVTGASAGWCDCLIKTWPIEHIIGENGALTMEKNHRGIVSTQFVKDKMRTKQDLTQLLTLGAAVTEKFTDIAFTQDQPFRVTDVAFDIGQAVSVEESVAEAATAWIQSQQVQARRSSIHINVWIGEHSKASSALRWLSGKNLSVSDSLFIGDSPNDETMFKSFPLSVGVANVERFLSRMEHTPAYMTRNPGGYGFVDLAKVLLQVGLPTSSTFS